MRIDTKRTTDGCHRRRPCRIIGSGGVWNLIVHAMMIVLLLVVVLLPVSLLSLWRVSGSGDCHWIVVDAFDLMMIANNKSNRIFDPTRTIIRRHQCYEGLTRSIMHAQQQKQKRFMVPTKPMTAGTTTRVSTSSTLISSTTTDSDTSSSISIDTETIRHMIQENIQSLCYNGGSDIRGRFVDHFDRHSIDNLINAMIENSISSSKKTIPALSPFIAYCIGYAFATMMVQEHGQQEQQASQDVVPHITIFIGMDPRIHGPCLAEALAQGILSYTTTTTTTDATTAIIHVKMGPATTPACASLVRLKQCDGAIMVTASHLPRDRNGFKLFTNTSPSGFTKDQIRQIGTVAETYAIQCLEQPEIYVLYASSSSSSISSTSDSTATTAALSYVDWMPIYAKSLSTAIVQQTKGRVVNDEQPLTGLKLLLNPGNGAGGFFQSVLEQLGADMSASMYLEPNGLFPNGIPNPEDKSMIQQTLSVCEEEQVDLGILLDTDADRCGFIVPRIIDPMTKIRSQYEPLNRNRLIALLGVIFAQEQPCCAVVTDSVTSEGLSTFLRSKLGLQHIRYIKGYANVIGKAKELTESGQYRAELAIETSGHCAMRENGYLDDGTYTAVKIVSLLAQQQQQHSTSETGTILDLIVEMSELEEVCELRMTTNDGSLDTMREIFDICISELEQYSSSNTTSCWNIDVDNLEGIRFRCGPDGEFFMLRKSLHDPIISLQIEANNKDQARTAIVEPIIRLLESNSHINQALNIDVLKSY